MIVEALKILSNGKDLDFSLMKNVMTEITEGKVTDIQLAAFLTALKVKGETTDEITAAAQIMKEKCLKTDLECTNTLDIVGTGGDMSNTFNISTTCAFVLAAGGVPVAKHGNRALTSKSGSVDVLEALGINVNKTTEQEKEIFKSLNLCFMFAKNHHPAMKYASNVRKELKFRTLFNILGPLTNPACAKSQLFGVFDEKLVHNLAVVISRLGVNNVLVVHGKDGLDEASVSDETVITEYLNGKMKDYTIKPEDFCIKRADKSELVGGNADDNALIIKNIFRGKETGAKKDIVILNSGLAFYTFGKTKSIQSGIELADNIIKSGLAADKLEKYIKISNEV